MTANTIASRLTPILPAGIATISVRGPKAISMVAASSGWQIREPELNRIYYALWPVNLTTQSCPNSSPPKEQVVLCVKHPQAVDIHCHGGNTVCLAILDSLRETGCRIVDADQWPSELSCPLARQAEHDLIQARSDKVAAVLLDQMNGQLRMEIEQISQLLECESHQLQQCTSAVEKLLATYDFGRHLIEGWNIVLAGPPNVGKSSLINAIAGQSRSIVHPVAGTTRDWVEAETIIDGWPITLTDTAGIRKSAEAVEREGITRALQRVRAADLLVLVVDAIHGWTATHQEIANATESKKLVCLNKVDLLDLPDAAIRPDAQADAHNANQYARFCNEEKMRLQADLTAISDAGAATIPVSTTTTFGLEDLMDAIRDTLLSSVPEPGAAVVFNKEQAMVLDACRSDLKNKRPEAAVRRLRVLLGAETLQGAEAGNGGPGIAN